LNLPFEKKKTKKRQKKNKKKKKKSEVPRTIINFFTYLNNQFYFIIKSKPSVLIKVQNINKHKGIELLQRT